MKRSIVFILLLSAAQFGYAAVEAANQAAPITEQVVTAPVETATVVTVPAVTVPTVPVPAVAVPVVTLPAVAAPAVEPVKPAAKAFNTKDASVNMAAIKKNPVFDERYKKLEGAYKRVGAKLQEDGQRMEQDAKAGKISESEFYGKSQQLEYEFRKAQKELQEGAMKLEETVDIIIAEILKAEGWDGCQVQYFSYINPARDITERVIAKLEERLKAEEAAEKFKKPAVVSAEPKAKPVVEKSAVPANKPAVKPAPKRQVEKTPKAAKAA